MTLKYVTSTLTAFALASTVSVFAQESTPAQQPTPAQPEKQSAPKETLTGCVAEAKTTTGATVYVLNNAEGGTAAMYVLSGSSTNDWKGNVSKKVEVTGPVQQPNPPSAEDEAAANTTKVLRPPVMQVESVQVVAETCK